MITKITSIDQLKKVYGEILMNKTTKVTKIADESIVNGISYGVAKVGQKALKDIALVETHLFPDYAFGGHLDDVAQKSGIAPRFAASQSSTYIRLVADVGTTYLANTHFFIGNGITFELTANITIGSEGYAYAKVRSQTAGLGTNIPSLTINELATNNAPIGHIFVTNEYQSTGGRNEEDDTLFRMRIKNGPNVLARNTTEYLTQILQKFNSDVLKAQSYGVNAQNQSVIGITMQNGIDLTTSELSQLSIDIKSYLSLTDYNSVTNTSIGVELINAEYQEIDVSFRCELIQNTDIDQTRKDIQIALSKYHDYRYWKPGQKVEWDDLLQIVKSDSSMKYVADNYFFPDYDVQVDPTKIPRIRGFVMLDLDGNLIIDNSNVLNEIYYPNKLDFSFQQTVL